MTTPRRRAGRLLASEDFRAGFVEMLPVCIGIVPFGLVCGVGAAAAGANFAGAMGLATIIFSGAAQILACQMLADGAPVAVVILTCTVLGLRFLMYSAAMAPILSPLPRRWSGAVAFLLTDQAFAAAIRKYDSHGDAHRAAIHYAGSGMALWTFWQITNAAGFYVGNVIPAAWSLEFAVPLCFLALLAPALRGAPHVLAAVVAGVAVMALDALPMRLNLVVAGLLGIGAGLAVEMAEARWKAR